MRGEGILGSVGWVSGFPGGAGRRKGDIDEGGGSRVGLAEERSLSEGLGTGSLKAIPRRGNRGEDGGGGLGVRACEVDIGIWYPDGTST